MAPDGMATRADPTPPSIPATMSTIASKNPKLADNWKTRPLEQLTDSDILSMPEAEYRNDVQLAYFRRNYSPLDVGSTAQAVAYLATSPAARAAHA